MMLGAATPEARTAADEAAATFQRLGAEPMLERLNVALRATRPTTPSKGQVAAGAPSTAGIPRA